MLTDRLRNVYWLGGGSGSGKSTIARRLAERFGLRLYSTDEVMSDHADRCAPADCPLLMAFRKMDMDERWVNRSPETMLETFHWFRGEAFQLIIEDLLALPADEGVLAEGFRLLPRLVRPLLARADRAAWLIPTPAFRAAAFERRSDISAIISRTGDPARALDNLLRRDQIFTAIVAQEAEESGLCTITVDLPISEEDLAARVASRLGLA